jgi:hypothetical protein
MAFHLSQDTPMNEERSSDESLMKSRTLTVASWAVNGSAAADHAEDPDIDSGVRGTGDLLGVSYSGYWDTSAGSDPLF